MPLLAESIILPAGYVTGPGKLAGESRTRGQFLGFQQRLHSTESQPQPVEPALVPLSQGLLAIDQDESPTI